MKAKTFYVLMVVLAIVTFIGPYMPEKLGRPVLLISIIIGCIAMFTVRK